MHHTNKCYCLQQHVRAPNAKLSPFLCQQFPDLRSPFLQLFCHQYCMWCVKAFLWKVLGALWGACVFQTNGNGWVEYTVCKCANPFTIYFEIHYHLEDIKLYDGNNFETVLKKSHQIDSWKPDGSFVVWHLQDFVPLQSLNCVCFHPSTCTLN